MRIGVISADITSERRFDLTNLNMPILEVIKEQIIMVIKRSMSTG
ncbi:hypothetical protein [Psychrobacter sp. SWN149]|nr:hypothetical protein [Psychrobacter sp. SWN149]